MVLRKLFLCYHIFKSTETLFVVSIVILENIPCVLENNVYSVGQNVTYVHLFSSVIQFQCFLVEFVSMFYPLPIVEC